MLFQALLAATLVSLVSLLGVITLLWSHDFTQRIIFFLIALASGTLLGSAFLHILPESIAENPDSQLPFVLFLTGFALFFVLERILYWHHCHHEEPCEVHPMGMLNLLGDGLHNFLDGILIITAFSTSFELGVLSTLAILLHEIPQELGDFGILLHAGYSRVKALVFNLLSALTAILGVLFGYFLTSNIAELERFFLPLAGGGFLYIAASDLIPILHTESKLGRAILSFVIFVAGMALMYYLGEILQGAH